MITTVTGVEKGATRCGLQTYRLTVLGSNVCKCCKRYRTGMDITSCWWYRQSECEDERWGASKGEREKGLRCWFFYRETSSKPASSSLVGVVAFAAAGSSSS